MRILKYKKTDARSANGTKRHAQNAERDEAARHQGRHGAA